MMAQLGHCINYYNNTLNNGREAFCVSPWSMIYVLSLSVCVCVCVRVCVLQYFHEALYMTILFKCEKYLCSFLVRLVDMLDCNPIRGKMSHVSFGLQDILLRFKFLE